MHYVLYSLLQVTRGLMLSCYLWFLLPKQPANFRLHIFTVQLVQLISFFSSGGLNSIPSQIMRDLRHTKWHRNRFPLDTSSSLSVLAPPTAPRSLIILISTLYNIVWIVRGLLYEYKILKDQHKFQNVPVQSLLNCLFSCLNVYLII
jgi:hypothetical protein